MRSEKEDSKIENVLGPGFEISSRLGRGTSGSFYGRSNDKNRGVMNNKNNHKDGFPKQHNTDATCSSGISNES